MIQRVLINRIVERSHLMALLVTFGLGIAMANVVKLIYTANPKYINISYGGATNIAGLTFPNDIHPLLHLYTHEQFVEFSQKKNEISARHSHYYSAFLQSLYHELIGRKQLEALQQIDADLENIRVGWQHTLKNLIKNKQLRHREIYSRRFSRRFNKGIYRAARPLHYNSIPLL